MLGIKNKRLFVYKIEQGFLLDQAKEIGVKEFFNKRMKNKPRKALVGSWLILADIDDFIYLGYPRFKSLFSNKRVIDELFKINKTDLQQELPTYSTLQGHSLKQAILKHLSKKIGTNASLLSWHPQLNRQQIVIEGDCQYTKDEKNLTTRYLLHLDKSSLDVLHLELLP